ncbi:MAG: ABC-type multidrug transport system, ATPase component, partial [Actinomycetia bacterium]|nr:ABC-type multidrug transport system, ATPase component [Actinomycetes bacterium]
MPIVFSSHQLELVERVCDRVVMIVDGRIVADGTIHELRASRARRLVRVEVAEAPAGWYEAVPGIRFQADVPGGVIVELDRDADDQRVLDLARSLGEVRHFSHVRPTLYRAVPRGGRVVSDDPALTDRGMWRVVAARDFSVRLSDKGFAISTAITVTVLSIFILLRAYAGGPDSFDLAVVGDRAVADRAAAIADRAGIDLTVVPLRDEGAVSPALRDGRVDAALIGAHEDVLEGVATLRVLRDVPSLLDQVVQAAAIATRLEDALEDAGASPDTVETLQDQHPVDAAPILPPDPDRDTKAAVALA